MSFSFFDNVIAYRKIPAGLHGSGKCNIHFADEAFSAVARLGNCCAVALDISKFFESIDHDRLKRVWCGLLGIDRLPDDHWAVFKAITRYAEVDRDLAYERLGFANRRRNGGWEYLRSKREMPIQLCSPSDFRRKIAGTDGLIAPNANAYGIPQGAPLSDLLANAYLMDFDVAPVAGSVTILERAPSQQAPEVDAPALFVRALALEATDLAAAEAAYLQALALAPDLEDAYLNLGAMWAEAGRFAELVRLSDAALQHCPASPLLHFNRAVALDHLERLDEAAASYERSLALDPTLADAHFNLAELHKQAGDERGALRHYSAYRRLQR